MLPTRWPRPFPKGNFRLTRWPMSRMMGPSGHASRTLDTNLSGRSRFGALAYVHGVHVVSTKGGRIAPRFQTDIEVNACRGIRRRCLPWKGIAPTLAIGLPATIQTHQVLRLGKRASKRPVAQVATHSNMRGGGRFTRLRTLSQQPGPGPRRQLQRWHSHPALQKAPRPHYVDLSTRQHSS